MIQALPIVVVLAAPVVVIAGHDEPGMAERAFALGASACLTKPVEELAFLAAINLKK